MRAKKSAFWLLLKETNPDIIIGSETWLHQGFYEREVLPMGYHFVARRDRHESHYGGVMIAAKDDILGTQLSIDTQTEFCAAVFECPDKQPLIIGSMYRPPSSDQQYMEELSRVITDIHQTHTRATLWIAGDANLPDIDWEANTIVGHNYTARTNQIFLDTIADIGSEQAVTFPTRGNNILDLFITNRPSLIERVKPVPGVSDHDIVFVQASTTAQRTKPPRRKILLWKKVDLDSLRGSIQNFSDTFTKEHSTNTDVDVLWDNFKEFSTKIIDASVPSKMTSQRFSQPWITRKAKRLSRRKKRAYKRAKASGDTEDQQRYHQLQKDTQYECRKAYNNYVKETVSEDRDPKKLYSFIKAKRCDSSGVAPLKSEGITYNDPKTKATLLNKQFCSVFTEKETSQLPSMDGDPYPDVHHFSVGQEGVQKLLRDLDPYKAAGPDTIPTKFLKEFASELSPALTLIFQASLQQGRVPKDWKQANVTPIFKKGDRSLPGNYRPISLTSVCCKILEHVIHSQVMKHLERHNILSDQQHGFRKRRSCDTQLLLTLQDLSQALENNEQIDAVLLDFSKAFDKVPHERLAVKLHHYGIRGNIYNWVSSFLAHRSQQVLVEGHSAAHAPVTSGVPQGSVLGPLLFLLYINDMPAKVTSTSRLFADDSLLYRKIKSTEDCVALQKDLDALQQWEQNWQMSFNPSKYEVLHIARKRNPIRTTYKIHGHDLEDARTGKYLGATIANNLSWKPHVDAKTKAANNSLAFLRRNLTTCPQYIKAQCYKTLVRPILEYAAPVWDPHTNNNINQLEAVQRRAARFITGDYRSTSSTSQMIANLCLPTLERRRQQAKLAMMFRITHNLVDIPADEYLQRSTLSTRGHGIEDQGDVIRYRLPYCRTDTYRHSFFPSGIRLWNQLPKHLTTTQTLEAFKGGLAVLDLTKH